MSSDLICIRKAHSLSEADVIVAVLQSQGFNAFVKDRNAIGMGTISPFSSNTREGTIPVIVVGEEDAREAARFLAEHGPGAERQVEDESEELLDAECGACGEMLWYGPAQAGQDVECPHCGVEVELPQIPADD